jgi:DNA-binding SARP family transcriptional activator
VRFQILGPLRVWDGAGWSMVRAPQQRALLAVLLSDAGRVVSVDRLIDEIWGENSPPTALNTIQGYVMRLRRMTSAAGPNPLITRGRGYELVLADGDLDADAFERLVESGTRDVTGDRLEAAVTQLGEALSLWRGPALADVPVTPTVAATAARLEQARLTATERRLDALLGLGRYAVVLDEVYRLVEEHPLRERFWAQLMLGLYHSGRRAEALEVYRRGRRLLVAELGLEPGAQLRELQRAILDDNLAAGRSAPIHRPAIGRIIPAQLPADVAGFTGRDAHLRRLDSLLPAEAESPVSVIISTIAGTAGIGKTALAVRWAHLIRDRFPDGQLYVNLRGYASGPPLRPVEALALFLHALGVPAEHAPADADEAAALYRSLLAGRRVLVLLDNARDAEQVRPLLPGSPGCLVLVTSRDQLAGLVALHGAVRLTLDVLTPAEARTLLCGLLPDGRCQREPAAAAELARLCGHLPLALRIAAANLTTHSGRPIADYNQRLRRDRLAALQVDGDPQAAVRAAFDLSYAAQPEDGRRLFRRLGLVPGPDVTADAAAALAGCPAESAGRLLDRLAGANLVNEPVPGRFSLHDLLRVYAAEQAGAEERPADRAGALGRLCRYYLLGLDGAATRVYPQFLRLPVPADGGAVTAVSFDGHADASEWLDAERANLVAAVGHAAAYGLGGVAARLADALRGYLFLRRHLVDWDTVAQAGLAAAAAEGDVKAQAAAHISLAMHNFVRANYEPAAHHYCAARELAQRAGWLEGESAALGNLGMVYTVQGRLTEAANHYTRALAIDRRTGWRDGQATKLANLGYLCLALGQPERAAAHHTQALALHQATGSRSGEAMTLSDLGEAYHAVGRFDDALDVLTRARVLHREVGDRSTEGATVRVLAAVHRDAGRHAEALDLARTAVILARDIGDRRQEAAASTVLASIHFLLGQTDRAIDGHTEALRLARDAGNRFIEAEALLGLADAYRRAGQPDLAGARASAAQAIARKAGYRVLEGQALTLLAAVHLDQGHREQAIAHAEQALSTHTATGHRLGQARTHVLLDVALRDTGRDREAGRHRDQARTLYAEIGLDRAAVDTRR